MKFGEIPIAAAMGAILAHSVRHRRGQFKKGRRLSADDIGLLEQSGVREVFAARLEDKDVPEDEAAGQLAQALAGTGVRAQAPFTGRANLHAQADGLVVIDVERINRLNGLDESITVATLPGFEPVNARQMLATVKVIPFAVDKDILNEAMAIITEPPPVKVAEFSPFNAGLIISKLPQTKDAIIDKSRASMEDRLCALNGRLSRVQVVDHRIEAVAAAMDALCDNVPDVILIFGASAIVDRGDVIPAACEAAGGEVQHLGMPVDPGNLIMLGEWRGKPVIGVPSCARSPKLNGFDWVLQRCTAGLPVASSDIMSMGVGGLLKEIPSRPSPRERTPLRRAKVAALVLAAGTSSRFGAKNKLLALVDGKPVVRHVVDACLHSKADQVCLVTGHEAREVLKVIPESGLTICYNKQFQSGLASSLKAGLAQLGDDIDAVLICLGDMPFVAAGIINQLIAGFSPEDSREICVPVHQDQRGNPVLIGRRFFELMMGLEGDLGAKAMIAAHGSYVVEVSVGDGAIFQDVDTPDALAGAVSDKMT